MKQGILFFFFIISMGLNAQVSGNKLTLNEHSIVRDSTGALIPYPDWQKMMESGDYNIKIKNFGSSSPEFQLFRLTPAEKLAKEIRTGKPRESAFFTTGKTIHDVKLVTLDGKVYRLSELTGKVVVLNFWFINCQPCRIEMPELNKIVEQYKSNKDVVFLAIALDEAKELKTFLKEQPFNYEIIDKGVDIAAKYTITTYPTHVVLDKEGKVDFHTSGYGTNTIPWLKKSIDATLNRSVN